MCKHCSANIVYQQNQSVDAASGSWEARVELKHSVRLLDGQALIVRLPEPQPVA